MGVVLSNYVGILSIHFPDRPAFLPKSAEICEGRVSRMASQRLRGLRLWVDDLHCRDGEWMQPVSGVAQLTVMGGAPSPLIGDRIRFRSHLHTPHRYHNPGAPDWERKALADGVAWTGSIESGDWMMVVKEGAWSPLRWVDQWRQKLAQQISTISDPYIQGSASALLLGNAGLLPDTLGDHLRYLGIIHLYVISGLHVAIVAWAAYELIYWLLSRRSRWALRYPLWRWSAAGAIVLVWIYAALVGMGVSVIRASVMISVYLLARIRDRHAHVGAAIALAAIILILQSPHVIFLPGFQLSFVAVMALVGIYPKLIQRFKIAQLRSRTLRWIGEAIIAASVATWATAPLVAYHFHQTPLLSVPANLLAAPYTTLVLMPLGLLWTVCSAIPGVSAFLQHLWVWAATPFVHVISVSGEWAMNSLWTFTPTIFEIVWWYALIPLSLWERARVKGIMTWCAVGLLIVSLHSYNYYKAQPLQITFLDVGQGASVLIEFPNRKTMLIDAGGAPGSDFDMGRWVVAPALLARGIAHVDTIALTHPHPDHYGGMAYIAEHFHPTTYLTNGAVGEERDPQWSAYMQRMMDAGMQATAVHNGMQSNEGDVQLTWRHPPVTGPDPIQNTNNGSLVADIQYGDFRAVIVGDVEKEAEGKLLQTDELGPVDVMQVPHHGSRTSSTEAFLNRLKPKIAVAQLGFENRYGFPHQEVVARYKRLDTALFRTDLDGAISMSTRPKSGMIIKKIGN